MALLVIRFAAEAEVLYVLETIVIDSRGRVRAIVIAISPLSLYRTDPRPGKL